MLARAWHRIRQFFGALRPRVRPEERADAYAWLTPAEQALFETMTLRDQEHGIVVLRRIKRDTPDVDRDLFAAALLHDCGKGDVRLWHRIAHVAIHAGAAGIAERLASRDGPGWRRALWRLRYHPDIGAELAQKAGSSPEVVRLISQQNAPEADRRLALLQAADDA
jgi:hypothetical protein